MFIVRSTAEDIMLRPFHDPSFDRILMNVIEYLPNHLWTRQMNRIAAFLPNLMFAICTIFPGVESELVQQPFSATFRMGPILGVVDDLSCRIGPEMLYDFRKSELSFGLENQM